MQLGKDNEAEKDFAQALALHARLKPAIDTRRVEAKGQIENKTAPTKT